MRMLNAVGAGDRFQSISKEVGSQSGGGWIILITSRLTATEGGEGHLPREVEPSADPTVVQQVAVGQEHGRKPTFQQFETLLPGGCHTSHLMDWCGRVRLDWDEARAWNAGVPVTEEAK